MENKFTVAVIIAVVCAAVAGLFGYRLPVRTNEKAALEQQVATLQGDKADLQSRLEKLTASQAALQNENEGLKAENAELQAKTGKHSKAAPTR